MLQARARLLYTWAIKNQWLQFPIHCDIMLRWVQILKEIPGIAIVVFHPITSHKYFKLNNENAQTSASSVWTLQTEKTPLQGQSGHIAQV